MTTKTIANDRARIDAHAARQQAEAEAKCVSRLRQKGYRVDEPAKPSAD